MNRNRLLYNFFILLMLQVAIVSCDDDELCSHELYVFTRNWTNHQLTAEQTYDEDGNLVINGEDEVKFPLYLSRETSVAVNVTVGLDECYIEEYNAVNSKSLKMIPTEAVSFNNIVSISAGALQSTDSIEVKFDMSKITPGTYLVPFKISAVESEDKGIKASSTSGIQFYILTVNLQNINTSNNAVKEGVKLDRASWTIHCDRQPDPNAPIDNLIDNDPATYWAGTRYPYSPIIIDMITPREFKALSFLYNQNSTSYAPTRFAVYISDDKEEWTFIGKTSKYNYGYNDRNKEYGINLLLPMKSRYVRLDILSATSGYYGPRLNEIYVIE